MSLAADRAADEFVRVAQRLWQRGMLAGSGGNISVRIAGTDEILIKPTGVANIDCRADTLLRTDLEGRILSGEGRPSTDLKVHLAIYQQRPEVRGIVHAHPPWSTALTLLGYTALPLWTPHAQFKLQHVPVLPFAAPGSEALTGSVLEAFQANAVAVLLERHGLVAAGASLSAAAEIAELVEETAQIAWLVQAASANGPMNVAAAKAIRDQTP